MSDTTWRGQVETQRNTIYKQSSRMMIVGDRLIKDNFITLEDYNELIIHDLA